MKVLMLTNGMEIGGAETHILELSSELVRMGHEVCVISSGGVYVRELEVCGIVHVNAPLNSHRPSKLIKSYFIIKNVINAGNFDIVHAHARIPAALCGLLQKKLRFRFMTTAHWVFKVTPLFKLMANWGEKTVAVSEDIKKYLIDNYGTKEKDISVTINGIDVQKFSPDIDCDLLKSELDINNDLTKIVYVSRMDTDRSKVAFMLLEALEMLDNPQLQAIIVGGGNDLSRLELAAQHTNRVLGRRAAIVTGARTDINKCIAVGDIFVGVSRAALEAMSCSKPVIIAGNEGYIGIFSEETFPVSLQTNFCCRGCRDATPQLIVNDINTLLKSDMRAVGEYNRNLIIERYSVSRMTYDYMGAYTKLLEKPSKGVVISGYYGYNNTGDDSVLGVIINNIKEKSPDMKITVLSARPEETKRVYGVDSINRYSFIKLSKMMKDTALLISGGGSLFQDATSTKSLLYYIAVIKTALRKKVKVMIYSNGIGPINSKRNRIYTQNILEKVDLITLRDEDSFAEIKALDVKRSDIQITADPAFAMVPATQRRLREVLEGENIDFDTRYVIISVRKWKHNCEEFEEAVATVSAYIKQILGFEPLFLPMQRSVDTDICNKIMSIAGCGSIIKGKYTGDELMAVISKAEAVVGMRLHTLIYAIASGVPVVGLSYDPKVDALMERAGVTAKHSVSSLNADLVCRSIKSLTEDKERYSAAMADTATTLRNKTEIDKKILGELI
ncbi:MAG: polysaccharide pyruvyl transferase CsaB [Eubacteriales bacterium]|nr:polysaccharide pyruvyl transferase CsaB [Eubacteriales bacterium]